MEDRKGYRRVLRAWQNEQRSNVFLSRANSALRPALGHDNHSPQICRDGFRRRRQKRSIRVRGFCADMPRDCLSKNGYPLTPGMVVAEVRKSQSPESRVNAHVWGLTSCFAVRRHGIQFRRKASDPSAAATVRVSVHWGHPPNRELRGYDQEADGHRSGKRKRVHLERS